MLRRSLLINPKDNVAVVLEESKQADFITVRGDNVILLEDVIFAHKVALKDFKKGDVVFKYGEDIGFAVEDISKGAWVHTHNMGCRRGK